MTDLTQKLDFSSLAEALPAAAVPILTVLALSFLIGLEREERAGQSTYHFGGIRTFPIIGLCGYLCARLAEAHPGLLPVGLFVLGGFFWLSYRRKLEVAGAGLTTEISGVFTFLMGALVYQRALWEATALTVAVLLLLELKIYLEGLARKIPPDEVYTFTRFLLIAAVVLPVVPDRSFTDLHINPFHTWLVVVIISALSYGAYLVERLLGSRSSLLVTAVLGGLYSSTSTTVVLARRSAAETASKAYSGAILLASGIMYLRLLVLLWIFSAELFRALLLPFAALGVLAALAGVLWVRTVKTGEKTAGLGSRNPLELRSALLFAFLFSAMGVLTALTLKYLGSSGMLGLSFVTGLTDVDPFVMSLTQSAIVTVPLAAKGIVIATASNNLMKGAYAAIGGSDGVRRQAPLALGALGAVSLVSLFFL